MLLFLAGVLIFLNAFFVAAEFAYVKVRLSQLETRAQKGSSLAKVASSIVRNLNAYLSATQMGITLASLGLGWIGEPAVADLLHPVFEWFGIVNPATIHTISVTVAFISITFLHIVVGEAAPKSLAIANAEGVCLAVAVPLRATYYILFPGLWFLNKSSNGLLSLFGFKPADDVHTMAVTAEELLHITSESSSAKTISENQTMLLTNVLSFSDRVAREIMVPRNKVAYLHTDDTPEDALKLTVETGKSRFPLVEEDLDHVVGLLHMKDLLQYLVLQRPIHNLREIVRSLIYVPENMPAQKLLLEFQKRQQHFACVVDEYGGISGIVTIEDALEELVGEIQDEFDKETPLIEKQENGTYIIDGSILLDELWKLTDMEPVDVEADTLSGFLMHKLNRLPEANDWVKLPNWKMTVLSMDGRRVGKVELAPVEDVIV